ncbi:MAG TPA: glycosyltransferase [Propionibacteriaceae bacterium]|nr:glycosyltransferase [Propionibacteriaceae bacterium]
MKKLAFIVPAYRRYDLTRACLRQLVRTCTALGNEGIRATAVVVADDANLETAEDLGFGTVRQVNQPLGRKWNDGIEYATRYLGCDYVVPFGTDNWIDPELVKWLPPADAIMAHREVCIVHESGERMVTLNVGYEGGDGIRCLPTELLEVLDFRPCDEDKQRATDTSMRDRLKSRTGKALSFIYLDLHPMQIVSFQSADQQLNDYEDLKQSFGALEYKRPFERLARVYSAQALQEVRDVFERRMAVA